MKKGKEIKSEQFKNYKIVYGSVNHKCPKTVYINISAWADPRNDDETRYGRIIRDFDKRVRQSIYDLINSNIVSPFAKTHTIVDFDIKESGVKYGKKSFMNCEITLFLKEELPIESEYIASELQEIINNVIKTTFESTRHFKFYKKKK